jgi:hypothetical protein
VRKGSSFRKGSNKRGGTAPLLAAIRQSLTPLGVLAAIAALGLAWFAFMNARVGVGLGLMTNTSMGAGFDSMRSRLSTFEKMQVTPGFKDQAAAVRVAKAALRQSPLNPRALRMLAFADIAGGRVGRAEAKMVMADRLSRRDGATQLWLADRRGRQGRIGDALRHIDVLLRTRPEATTPLLERLAVALALPEARAAIKPMIVADTPWIERFFAVAVERSASMVPLGELVASLREAPRLQRLEGSYASLVYRLAGEHQYDLLRKVYVKLPGARVEDIYDVSLRSAVDPKGYRPVIWDFGSRSDRGATMLGPDEAEFFAMTDVRGVAASKAVFLKSEGQALRFRKNEGDAGDGAAAFWRVTCVLGRAAKTSIQSRNLLEAPNGTVLRVPFPAGCGAAQIEMIVDGAMRRDPTRVVLSEIGLSR